MEYIIINTPPYPFFIFSGDALYRSGDMHRRRSDLKCFDLLFVEHGCLYMKEGQNHYQLKENHVLILSPGHEHQGFKQCTEETYFHWLHFYTTEEFFTSDHVLHVDCPHREFDYPKIESNQIILPVFQKLLPKQADEVLRIVKQLESLSVNRYKKANVTKKDNVPPNNSLQQQQMFMELLSLIAVQRTADKSTSSTVTNVILYLESHYHENITLETMAIVANCHPTHLIRCFKNDHGTTPNKVLTNIRIQHAKELLSQTTLSCEKIAEQTGFSNGSYFSKVFKNQVGITPEHYRQQEISF